MPTGRACDDDLLLTQDGKTVICSVFAPGNGSCTTGQLALNAYSVATGKLERVLFRYKGGCAFGFVQVLWARSAELAIGLIVISKPVTPHPLATNAVGAVAAGKFTPLPVPPDGGAYTVPGTVAF